MLRLGSSAIRLAIPEEGGRRKEGRRMYKPMSVKSAAVICIAISESWCEGECTMVAREVFNVHTHTHPHTHTSGVQVFECVRVLELSRAHLKKETQS